MKTILVFCLTLFLNLFSSASHARELLVFASDSGGVPADAMCFFSNSRLVIHVKGLLVHYTCLGGRDIYGEVWLVGPEGNRMIVRSQEGNLLTDAFVNGSRIFVMEFSEFETVAIHEDRSGKLIKHDLPQDYRNAHVHDMAALGEDMWFRYTNRSRNEHGEGLFRKGSFLKLPARGVTYFFTPSSSKDIFLQITRHGGAGERGQEQPDSLEIRLAPDFKKITILKDRDADPQSSITHFRNLISVNGAKWATVAKALTGNVLVIGEKTQFQIHDLSRNFKAVDFFLGAIDSQGNYFFRGTHHDGRFGLWKFRTDLSYELILKSGEEVRVDDMRLLTSQKNLFYGPPVVDDSDQILMGVGLEDPDTSRDIGQGVLRL